MNLVAKSLYSNIRLSLIFKVSQTLSFLIILQLKFQTKEGEARDKDMVTNLKSFIDYFIKYKRFINVLKSKWSKNDHYLDGNNKFYG